MHFGKNFSTLILFTLLAASAWAQPAPEETPTPEPPVERGSAVPS